MVCVCSGWTVPTSTWCRVHDYELVKHGIKCAHSYARYRVQTMRWYWSTLTQLELPMWVFVIWNDFRDTAFCNYWITISSMHSKKTMMYYDIIAENNEMIRNSSHLWTKSHTKQIPYMNTTTHVSRVVTVCLCHDSITVVVLIFLGKIIHVS